MKSAAIYARISQDREGAGLGVGRQTEDCEALCERIGWKVVGVYSDNDVSAYSGKPRPEWQRLLADVENGTIDAIVVWHVDRLTRSPVELEHVIDLADRYGLKLATVTGEVDLATPTGRMVARILGATARQEAEHKAERQRRQRRQSAEAGRVSGGGGRPFGYGEDQVTIVEEEAAVIREVAKRVLAGESLSSVCRDLVDRDVRTTSGGTWRPTTLRRYLASARISGRREHSPRRTGETTRPLLGEIVANAVWPGIISPAESDRLRSLLSNPDRRRNTGTGRTYLLSGLLWCGRCGARMCGRPRSGTPRYVCPNTPGTTNCGGTATNAARTDEFVRDLVVEALSSSDLASRLRESSEVDPELPASIKADEAQLEELASAWADGEITRSEWKVARDVIEKRLDRNRSRFARVSASAPVDTFVGSGADLVGRWDEMNVSQRRAVVGAVLDRVEVGAANPRVKWDPARFSPRWVA